jgi:hypothetical protein
MDPTAAALQRLLEQVSTGAVSLEVALTRLLESRVSIIDGATVDLGRSARCGLPEAIYGEGKAVELVVEIARRLLADGAGEVLVTRIEPMAAKGVASYFSEHRYAPKGRTLRLSQSSVPVHDPDRSLPYGPVAVVTAGSTDDGVAEEASETLGWMGVGVHRINDVGVAGPQRLLSALPLLRSCKCAVVVAGMEGALPSVVAGHVGYPIIAVPTSVGYGAALGGITPLLTMLTSCAANVAVVNIDAGFKGGYVAGLIARSQVV